MRMYCLIVVLCATVLTGCEDSMNKAKQDQACAKHGGVYEYTLSIFTAYCIDGTRQPKPEKLVQEFYPKSKVTSHD